MLYVNRLAACFLFILINLSSIAFCSDVVIVSDDFNGALGTSNDGRALNNGLGGSASCAWLCEDQTSLLINHPNDGTVALESGLGADSFTPPLEYGKTYRFQVLLTKGGGGSIGITLQWRKMQVTTASGVQAVLGVGFADGWIQALYWGAVATMTPGNPRGSRSMPALSYNSGDRDASGNIPVGFDYKIVDRSSTSTIQVSLYTNGNFKASYTQNDFQPTGHNISLIGGTGRGIFDNVILTDITPIITPSPTTSPTPGPTPTPQPTPTPVAWLGDHMRRVNLSVGYTANYHRAVMEEMPNYIAFDADYYLASAIVVGYAYYNSSVATKTPDLGSIDSIHEIIDAIRAGRPNAKFVAYMNMRNPVEAPSHSTWLSRDASGNSINWGGYQCCLTGPFMDEYVKPAFAGSEAPYSVDGFWLDGGSIVPPECFCDYCAAAFKADTGYDIPKTNQNTGNPIYVLYMRWRTAQQDKNMKELIDYMRAINPEAVLQSNSSHWRYLEGSNNMLPSQSENFCRTLDETCAEMFWHVDHQGDPIFPFFVLRYSRGIQGDRAPEMWCPPTIHGLDDGSVPLAEPAWPHVYDPRCRLHTAASIGWGHYEDLTQAFAEIKSREPWLKNTKSSKHIALLASANSRDFYGRNSTFEDYMKELFGCVRAVTEEHLPVDIIGDINLERDDLSRYKAILIPDGAALTGTSLVALRNYVYAGGGLVATGRTSLMDANGVPQSNFVLSDVLGADYVNYSGGALDARKLFMVIPTTYHSEDTVLQHAGVHVPLCMGGGIGNDSVSYYGNVTEVNIKSGASKVLDWLDQSAGYRSIPAVINNTYGAGLVTFIPTNLGKSYFAHGYPYLRRILCDEIERVAGGAPEVTVSAPKIVQATYFTQPYKTGNRLIVHLLNEAIPQGRPSLGMGAAPVREEVVQIAGVKIRINSSAVALRAVAEPEGVLLEKTSGAGYQEFTLPALGLYQLISIEPDDSTGSESALFY